MLPCQIYSISAILFLLLPASQVSGGLYCRQVSMFLVHRLTSICGCLSRAG